MPKMKRPRSRLNEPAPSETDTRGNLNTPETAPLPEPLPATDTADGRSLRATGRTIQFATRVTKAWKTRLHRLAKHTGKMYVELLEEALDDLEKKLDNKQ